MLYRRTLVKVFILTSLFWLSVDILFFFNILNVQFDLFSTEKLIPSFGENRGYAKERKRSYSEDIFGVIDGLGEGGKPATLPPHLKDEAEKVFNNHSFDVILSDKISLDRALNDYRGPRCKAKHKKYPKNLPTTSVIICFHNEALSVLLRTVHSVMNRTPPDLLADIILVDDSSEYENLQEPLERQVSKFEKVQVIRMGSREGLVRSRLRGAAISRGEVLTFLDSHCEVTKGWVEPLLARIAENRSNVVCPVIEVIDADTFKYETSDVIFERGGFTWDLFFTWKAIPESEKKRRKDDSDFIRSPTMAGGLFSIHKQYFYDLGSYDDQMDIWGGENLELSFRIWMCGGQLEIVPCSRVGHVFRKYTSPYKFPKGTTKTLAKNFNRLAEVWMDEYKEIYYRKKSQDERNVDIGDISHRVALRKRLKCNSFKWYMDNIFPDMAQVDPDPPAQGEIRNVGSNLCVDTLGMKSSHVARIGLYQCHGMGGNQFFTLSKGDEIVFNDDKCLDVPVMEEGAFVESYPCHGLKGNQEWKHDKAVGTVIHVWTGHCLDLSVDKEYAVLNICDGRDAQRWKFSKYKGENVTLDREMYV